MIPTKKSMYYFYITMPESGELSLEIYPTIFICQKDQKLLQQKIPSASSEGLLTHVCTPH